MKATGAVLLSALLFLLILSLLAMSIMQTSLLEMKMSTNYQDKIFALQRAEINLNSKEKAINSSHKLPTEVTEIPTAVCGVTFYRVQAVGEYHKTKVTLQSIFAVIGNINLCNPKPLIHAGCQSWREL